MSLAFVLGNGVSRQGIDLKKLQSSGQIFGCNALYREFAADVLVATDRPIAEQIQNAGYANKHVFYTRRPLPGLGAQRIPENYWGYSSGPAAVGIAALAGHCHIYLLGFDMGPSLSGRFNNVYANTEFYKSSAAVPTYSGNWARQICQIVNEFKHTCFYRVKGATTASIKEFDRLVNFKNLTMEEFQAQINI